MVLPPFTPVELKRLFGNQIDDNIIREIAAMDSAKQLKAIEDVKLYLEKNPTIKKRFVSEDNEYFMTTVQPYSSEGLNIFGVNKYSFSSSF